jgi:hypothetical protein
MKKMRPALTVNVSHECGFKPNVIELKIKINKKTSSEQHKARFTTETERQQRIAV